MTAGIYRHISPSGKFYVGQSYYAGDFVVINSP